MTTKPNLINDTWEVVQHNWHETSIYAKENNQRICKLDTEDWDVDEDNQYELESVQLKLARLVTTAPDMLKVLEHLQKEIVSGNIQLNAQTQELINQVVTKAINGAV